MSFETCHACLHQFTPAHTDQDICSPCAHKFGVAEAVRRRCDAARASGIEAAAKHVDSFLLEIHAPNGDLVRCDLSALVESIRGLK